MLYPLGPVLVGLVFPMAGFGTSIAMIVGAFGFAVAGRDSKEGRWALIVAWMLLFTWGASLASSQRMMRPSFGENWVPVPIVANGATPVREPNSIR
jgi:hypothetical protein